MSDDFRCQVLREFPELASGFHLPMLAEVLAVPDSPKSGGISDGYRPRLAVNVILLDSNYQQTEIKIDHVPVGIMGGGDERGFFAIPQKGTLVELAFFNGSPERPFIRSVVGERQALPWNDANTMSWQQSENAKQSVDLAGNWKRETVANITDKSNDRIIEARNKVETLGEEIKRVLQNSYEDVDGVKQIEVGALHQLSMTVANILALGNINQVAGGAITRSATGKIKDSSTSDLEQVAKNLKAQAETNMELIGQKVHLGSESTNVLKVVSDLIQVVIDGFTAISTLTVTCQSPGNPSGVPINASDFLTAVQTATEKKTLLDNITK